MHVSVCFSMKNSEQVTERKASHGMIRFILIIFALAVVMACVYMFFFTPGEVPPAN